MRAAAKNPEDDWDLHLSPDEQDQDQINETICLKLNDLEYRVDDLELWKKSRATKQPGTGTVACK